VPPPIQILGFVCGIGIWTQNHSLSHSTSPFVWRVFSDRVSGTICLSWLQTSMLLISASWIARIIGVSHRRLTKFHFQRAETDTPWREATCPRSASAVPPAACHTLTLPAFYVWVHSICDHSYSWTSEPWQIHETLAKVILFIFIPSENEKGVREK
jgi:hypothetical protein